MTHRPGPRQRAILEKMQAGARLARLEGKAMGEWYLDSRLVAARPIVGLHTYGYIMFDVYSNGITYYTLTEQGKAAIG